MWKYQPHNPFVLILFAINFNAYYFILLKEFKKAFSARVIELSETIFEKENVNRKIDEYVQLMELPMENHYHRFFGESNEKFYYWVNDIREFFNHRKNYVLKSIETNFGEEYLGETAQ